MSRLNVKIIERAQPSGIDLVGLFLAPDPSLSGIDVTPFEGDFETEFIAGPSSVRPATRGLQGFAEAWRDWLKPWKSYYVELEELIDAGDEVVSLTRVLARSTHDAVALEQRSAAVWSLREGRIVRVRFYLDQDQALEGAALRE